MNMKNIEVIMKSNLWKKITKHSAYRGHYIVHTEKQNPYVFCSLWVFFTWEINDVKLQQYWREGRNMIRTEGLDPHELPIVCYGKALVFS